MPSTGPISVATGASDQKRAKCGRTCLADEIERQRLNVRCPVDRQIHSAIMFFTKPPASYGLDIAPVEHPNDVLYRCKRRKPDRVRNGVDQTCRDIQIRISEPVVHRMNQQTLGALPKARVHRDGCRGHQHVEWNLLRLRQGKDCIKCVAGDRH